MKEKVASVFRTKTRDEWCALMEHTDVCFAPVLSLTEAPSHPHNVARGVFVELDGVTQPGPAPRFSRTALDAPTPPQAAAEGDAREVLSAWGLSAGDVAAAQAAGVLASRR